MPNKDVDAARLVFGLSNKNLPGGIGLRPFTSRDVQSLTRLGDGDAFFAWERSEQQRPYYQNLLRFRLQHYVRYGYGVLAVTLDDTVVGQFGLQVLDAALDRVEVVAFINRYYTQQGVGAKLMASMRSSAVEAGMRSVWGVVREDNPAGMRLMTRENASDRGLIHHFQQSARLFEICLAEEEI